MEEGEWRGGFISLYYRNPTGNDGGVSINRLDPLGRRFVLDTMDWMEMEIESIT